MRDSDKNPQPTPAILYGLPKPIVPDVAVTVFALGHPIPEQYKGPNPSHFHG